MFGLSYIKLAGLAIAAAAVLSFVLLAFHWKNTMTERGEKLAAICQTTRDASGNPKLKCGEVPDQIKFMGETITALKNALHVQNDAVAALGAQTKQQQADSAKASQVAEKRAQGAQATSGRLATSSRSSEAQAKPCEPSQTLKGSWQ